MTGAEVSKIRFNNDRQATSVEYVHKGQFYRTVATQEIILSAGAIKTPQIMELSGIGDPEKLKQNEIEVVNALPGVGENLQDHLQIRMVFKVNGVPTLNEKANSILGRVSMALEYALFRSGPLSMAPSQMGCFVKSDSMHETPNLEYHVQPLSAETLGAKLHPFPAVTASVCNLRPQSRGTVHIRNNDFKSSPIIKPNYLSAVEDKTIAVKGINMTRKICSQPALRKYNPIEIKPGDNITDHEDLVKAAGDIATTIFHPVGTCRMGHDSLSVVNDKLQVHGVDKLRIVDASIMPTITSGNTNSPVIMISEKAASMILSKQ